MSPTPRTDVAAIEVDVAFIGHDGLTSSPQRYVEVEFAQQLERELADLVRDARRFRRMEARYYDGVSGRPEVGSVRLERWDAVWQDWLTLTDKPLAEIADALPEVEG